MNATDIVGYTFNAANYCPACMRRIAANEAEANGKNSEFVPLDTLLDYWAEREWWNREDETSYDSNDFPKVIFFSDCDPSETCEKCGDLLFE